MYKGFICFWNQKQVACLEVILEGFVQLEFWTKVELMVTAD